tara:strand:- start:4377 stop:7970 length:3594 start_codon:yes stop_codon:yes gene_type:complete
MATKEEVAALIKDAVDSGEDDIAEKLIAVYDSMGTAPQQDEGITPEDIKAAGFEGLAETMRGFKELRAPYEEPLFYGEDPNFATQALRGIGAGASRIARGIGLETGLALAEPIIGRERLERVPTYQAEKALREAEELFYRPSASIDDVLDDPKENILPFIGETLASSAPSAVAALVSLPAYALSMLGDIAKKRAANRGPDAEVTGADLLWAAGTSGIVAGGERLGARYMAGGAPASTGLGRIGQAAAAEGATEVAQESLQTIGEQAFTREGEDYVLGVDPLELGKRALGGLIGGGPAGGVVSGAVELGRLPSERTVSRLERELEAIETRQAERGEPTLVAEEAIEETVAPPEEVAVEGDIVEQAVPTQEPTAQDAEVQAAEEVVVEGAKRAEERARQEERDSVPRRPRAEPAVEQEVVEEVDVSTPEEDLRSAAYDPFSSDEDIESALGSANAALNEDGMASRKVDYEEDLRAKLEEQGVNYDELTAKQRVGYQDLVNALDGRGMRSKIVIGDDGVPVLQSPERLDSLRYNAINNNVPPDGADVLALNNAIQTSKRAQSQLKDILSEERLSDDRRMSAERQLDAAARVEIESMLALRIGAGELGRALRALQYVVSPDLTLNQAKASARYRAKRKLSAKEEADIEKFWLKAEKELARTKDLYQKAMKDLKSARAKYNKAVERGAPDADLKRLDKAVKKAADKVQSARSQAQKAQKQQATVSQEAMAGDLKRLYSKVFGVGIAMNSAGDASALGRQAIFLAMQNPVEALKTAKWMFKAAPFSPGYREFARSEMESMLSSRTNRLFTAAGGELTEVEGLSNSRAGSDPMTAREENFMFNISESGFLGRWFGSGFLIPSQNVFALTLNRLRLANFAKGVELLADNHAKPGQKPDVRSVPRRDIEGLAKLINVSTGRTTGRLNSDNLGFLRYLMFAPRFTMSRVENVYRAAQVFTGRGEFGRSLSPTARKQFRLRIGGNLGFMMGIAAMAAAASSDDSDDLRERIDSFYDPGSADFLKVRVGDTHFDLMGGTSATMRYLLPYTFTPFSGDDVIATKDLDSYVRGGLQLVNNKLAPFYQAMRSLIFNKDWRLRELDKVEYEENPGLIFERMVAGKESGLDGALADILNRVIFPAMGIVAPIPIKSAAEGWLLNSTQKEKDLVEEVLLPQAVQFFGIGAQVYDPKEYRKGAIPKLPTPPRMPRP